MTAKRNQATAAAGEDCREALSCLIDGELEHADCARMIERICGDRQVRDQWALLHAAGDALRSSEVAALHSSAFVERVAAALEREPAILAPRALASGRLQRVIVPGAAVAAAAALLALVAVPLLRGGSGNEVPQIAAVPAPTPPNGAMQRVEVVRVPELERYLRAHRELAGSLVMPDATPYLRTSNNLPAEAR